MSKKWVARLEVANSPDGPWRQIGEVELTGEFARAVVAQVERDPVYRPPLTGQWEPYARDGVI